LRVDATVKPEHVPTDNELPQTAEIANRKEHDSNLTSKRHRQGQV